MKKAATLEILEILGADRLMEARGVKPSSIRAIRTSGRFREGWHLVVLELAEELGVDVDAICAAHGVTFRSLFRSGSGETSGSKEGTGFHEHDNAGKCCA